MAEYKVKLIMSDEFVVNAKSKEEAERKAREKFGCDYYIDDVETEITKPYDFWCNLSGDYKDLTCCDEWGAATLWLNDKQGVEYNFCIDGDCNSCAIYKMYYDEETDTEGTDYSTFEHYEIDFSNVNWKAELEKAMYEVAKKFFESEVE